MNCPVCGLVVNQGESICGNCGSALQIGTVTPQQVVVNTQVPVQPVIPVVETVNNIQQVEPVATSVNVVNKPLYQMHPTTEQPVVANVALEQSAIPIVNNSLYEPTFIQPVVDNQPNDMLSKINQMDIVNSPVQEVSQPQVVEQIQYPVSNSVQEINQETDDLNEVLMEAYIGQNSDRLQRGGFSAEAFVLSFTYLFYRKMWLFGTIVLAVIFGSYYLLPENIYGILYFGIMIFNGIAFKKLYLKHVTRKVNTIKRDNRNKSREQLILLCGRRGGAGIGGIFAPLIVAGVALFCLGLLGIDIFNYNGGSLKEFIGYKWIGNDNSALYLNEDKTFTWYVDDADKQDNYLQGTYEIYSGNKALEYVRNNLSMYGITEGSEKERIAQYDMKFDNKALKHYYILVLNKGKSVIKGEASFEVLIVPYLGFYNSEEKYFDCIDMEKMGGVLTREDSSTFMKVARLSYRIPANYSNVSDASDEFKHRSLDVTHPCEFTVKHKDVGAYKTAKDYLNKGLKLSDIAKVGKIGELKINDNNWYLMSISDLLTYGGEVQDYVAIYDKRLYEVTLKLPFGDTKQCGDDFLFVLNSLTFEKLQQS